MTQSSTGAAEIPQWPTEMVELTQGIHAYVQGGGGLMISNAGVIAGGQASVAVDALFAPRMTRAFLDEAAKVTAAPIDTLINTHHHIDHTLGNYAFRGRTIIAHELTRPEMLRTEANALRTRVKGIAPHFSADMDEPFEIIPPNLLYSGRMSLYVDEREVQLIHVPTAHTIDDTLVYLPAEKLLFAGDVCFFYVTPLAFEGSILGWIEALKTVEGMEVERIVPGHGPVGTLEDVTHLRGYFEHLRDEARRRYDAGTPAEQALMEIGLGPYAGWTEPERIAPNVLRLYEDFAQTPWAPLDLTAMRALQGEWLARHGE